MQIDLEQLSHLIAIAEQANIDELEVSDHEQTIRITCTSTINASSTNLTSSRASLPIAVPNNSRLDNQAQSALASKSSQTPYSDNNPPTEQPIKQADKLPTENADMANEQQKTIDSPMVGTFYRKASPDAAAFIEEQSQVKVGDTLCIIEAMKIMHEVKAEQAGVIKKILVKDGDMVEYGQPLIEIQA